MSPLRATLAVPGDLATPTGGYAYARRLLEAAPAAGLALAHLPLPAGFPEPSAEETRAALAALAATEGPLLVDGLAHGALPAAGLAPFARRLAVLHHHPLGLEPDLRQVPRRLRADQRADGAPGEAGQAPPDGLVGRGQRVVLHHEDAPADRERRLGRERVLEPRGPERDGARDAAVHVQLHEALAPGLQEVVSVFHADLFDGLEAIC